MYITYQCFKWRINCKWRRQHKKSAPNTVMHENLMFTLYSLCGKHSNDQTFCRWLKQRGSFLFWAHFRACCLSILIDLSLDFQYHIITPVHVVIVGFLSFIYKCMSFRETSSLSWGQNLMQTEKVLCFLYLEIELNMIGPFDRAIFCMTLPHSLWVSEIIKNLHCAYIVKVKPWQVTLKGQAVFLQPHSLC